MLQAASNMANVIRFHSLPLAAFAIKNSCNPCNSLLKKKNVKCKKRKKV